MIGSDLNKIPGKNLETNASMLYVCVKKNKREEKTHVDVFVVSLYQSSTYWKSTFVAIMDALLKLIAFRKDLRTISTSQDSSLVNLHWVLLL